MVMQFLDYSVYILSFKDTYTIYGFNYGNTTGYLILLS